MRRLWVPSATLRKACVAASHFSLSLSQLENCACVYNAAPSMHLLPTQQRKRRNYCCCGLWAPLRLLLSDAERWTDDAVAVSEYGIGIGIGSTCRAVHCSRSLFLTHSYRYHTCVASLSALIKLKSRVAIASIDLQHVVAGVLVVVLFLLRIYKFYLGWRREEIISSSPKSIIDHSPKQVNKNELQTF